MNASSVKKSLENTSDFPHPFLHLSTYLSLALLEYASDSLKFIPVGTDIGGGWKCRTISNGRKVLRPAP